MEIPSASPVTAGGYVRVSLKRQAEGYSPSVQTDAIRAFCHQQGWALVMLAEDHESGLSLTRDGYQRLLEAARHGEIDRVVLHMFDRFGRDSGEWITRANELERMGVAIYSVVEGKDQGGLLRAIHAGMAEQLARNIAAKSGPSRVQSAHAGTHMGVTPYGYQRVYAAHTGSFRRPAGELVICEAEAAWIRALFARYARGGASCRSLAKWLNAAGAPSPRSGVWWAHVVNCMLKNPVYIGKVRYNCKPTGRFAPPQPMFVADGRHAALVDEETWNTVQERLTNACKFASSNWTAGKAFLGTGILRCAECGGRMITNRLTGREGRMPYYRCARNVGGSGCTTGGYSAPMAHTALLAEVARLCGTPWTPQKERRLLGGPESERSAHVAALKRSLAAERAKIERNVLLMHGTGDAEPSEEEVRALRAINKTISATIKSITAELEAMGQQEVRLPDLRGLHDRLRRTSVAAMVERLRAQGDEGALRELVLALVLEARLVERMPDTRATWGRMEVTWTADVQALLDAGLLTLAPPAPAPETPPPLHRRRKSRPPKGT